MIKKQKPLYQFFAKNQKGRFMADAGKRSNT